MRLRLERENNARELVSERLKRIVGEETFQKLTKGGPALRVLSDAHVKAEFNRGLAQIRDSPDLPNDVLDWFEVRPKSFPVLNQLLAATMTPCACTCSMFVRSFKIVQTPNPEKGDAQSVYEAMRYVL